jgi:hypothetical protein
VWLHDANEDTSSFAVVVVVVTGIYDQLQFQNGRPF